MAVGWAPFWPRWGGKPLAGAGEVGVDRVDSTHGSSPFHHFQRMSRPPHPTPLPHDHLPLPCLLLSSQQSPGCGHAGAGEPLLWPPPPPCPAWRQAAACGGPAHPGVGHHRGEPHAAALDGTGGVQRPRWGVGGGGCAGGGRLVGWVWASFWGMLRMQRTKEGGRVRDVCCWGEGVEGRKEEYAPSPGPFHTHWHVHTPFPPPPLNDKPPHHLFQPPSSSLPRPPPLSPHSPPHPCRHLWPVHGRRPCRHDSRAIPGGGRGGPPAGATLCCCGVL